MSPPPELPRSAARSTGNEPSPAISAPKNLFLNSVERAMNQHLRGRLTPISGGSR